MSIKNLDWHFDNTYAKLPDNFFTKISPEKVSNPRLVMMNHALAAELGLNLKQFSDKELAKVFSGNELPPGAEPLAQAYAGHQYGQFTFLGDGRAHLLGELITPQGHRVDIQFKGSGKTPYSRRGDGRAALEPMLREYVISEAMHALNIPTTRSLAVVSTGDPVYRETVQPGAILTRIAASHVRVGTFEYLHAKEDVQGIKLLADYVIERHFPKIKETEHPYLHLLKILIEKQADLIVEWMRVGFIHGVMNTDNTAISCETMDYGPCAFMDEFHPETVFSSIDFLGRYSYINQPVMGQWNLARFAETILPLLNANRNKAIQIAEEEIDQFASIYQSKWLVMMRSKLGLIGEKPEDLTLIRDLLGWMVKQKADYTNTFRDLSSSNKLEGSHECQPWYESWQLRLKQNGKPLETALKLMQANNPAVIPRNHKVNQALHEAALGHMEPFHNLLAAVSAPYTEGPSLKDYQSPPNETEKIHQTFCGT